MIDTQNSLLGAPSCGAPIVSSSGAAPDCGVALAIALARPDVLIVAAARLGCPASPLGGARRPPRPPRGQGYAAPTVVQRKPVATKATTTKATTSRSGGAASGSSSSSTSKGTSAGGATSGPLGFLDDPKLSVDEKLFRFMCYMSDKYDKEIDKKLKEISGTQGSSSGSSSSSKASKPSDGGLLEGILGGGGGGLLKGILGKVFGGCGGLGSLLSASGLGGLVGGGLQDLVGQLSGPVLAAGASVLGFPALAPALLQAGPQLTDGVFRLLGGAKGGGSGTSSSAGTSSSSSGTGASKAGEAEVSQKDMLELQRLMEKQKEMFGAVSNTLRAMHDTKMAVINNLHG